MPKPSPVSSIMNFTIVVNIMCCVDFFMSCVLVGFESKLLSTPVQEIHYHLYITPGVVLIYVLQVRT